MSYEAGILLQALETAAKQCLPEYSGVEPHVAIMSLADDWQGLYVNNNLVKEGHRIYAWDVLEALERLAIVQADIHEDWSILEESGATCAPEKLPEKYRVK